jgi:lipoate---protein ligase
MQLLDLTLETPEENLALDEALLESAESSVVRTGGPGPNSVEDCEVLRLWESKQFAVVVGSSSRLDDEVYLDACVRHGVPVLRRPSGGAAIVAGPGCLMYALVLSYQQRPKLRSIDQAHRFVLETIANALRQIMPAVERAGTSDLVHLGHKFSGNSLRCKREHLLYHGTLLYRFPLEQIERLLRMPPRQPNYRRHRQHGEFVANLPIEAHTLRQTLSAAFQADRPMLEWPHEITARLAAEKYANSQWNRRS